MSPQVLHHPLASDTVFVGGETLADALEDLARWLRANRDEGEERGVLALTTSYPTLEEEVQGDTDVEVTAFLMTPRSALDKWTESDNE